MNKIFLVLCFGASIVSGCNAQTQNEDSGETVSIQEQGLISEELFCSDGLKVSPLRVSGKNWNEGVGNSSASILLDVNSVDGLSSYVTAQLSSESTTRSITSARITANGRQIVTFDGKIIADPKVIEAVCLRK